MSCLSTKFYTRSILTFSPVGVEACNEIFLRVVAQMGINDGEFTVNEIVSSSKRFFIRQFTDTRRGKQAFERYCGFSCGETVKRGEDMDLNTTIPFSLESIYNLEGEIQYELVKTIATRIISGASRIIRLNECEEQGRIHGGQRNVEASLIAAASERADCKGISKGSALQRSEEAIEAYAKHEGIWFDFHEDLNDRLPQIAEGFEAFVFLSEDEGFVVKAAHFADCTPLESLDERVSIFNYLFPETAYELVGFTRCDEGKFRFVLQQPVIIGNVGIDDPKGLAKRMRGIGLFATTDPEKFENSNYSVRDVHSLNYIKTADRVFIIDAITSLNSPEYGGRREYHLFSVEATPSPA